MNDYLRNLLLNSSFKDNLIIITPKQEYGAQLSLVFKNKAKEIFKKLSDNHIIADWREPNVIRVAPVALYNTFQEIFEFVKILEKIHREI